MAPCSKHPPDKGAAKKIFKCHTGQKSNSVICIICQNVNHKSDFDKAIACKFGTKYLCEVLVLCPELQDLDLTNKPDENYGC